ncbi:MAG: helix-turn-helix transcriptional regulator [Chitinophagaceae bacterium]|nr:helix-turn-helix transcriptional regulator [Chitinophagaceae bacterium]
MKQEDLGSIIQKRRTSLALKQEDLAEIAGVTIKTIYSIENNKGNPTFQVLQKILSVLGLEFDIHIKKAE